MTEIKLISENENPLFSRKEMKFEIKSEIVPSHDEVKKLLFENFSIKPELVRTNRIVGKFGNRVFEVLADVYSSKAEFDRVVRKTKKEKEKEKKEAETKKISEGGAQ
jgi:ribosomal protein S24E